MKNKRTKVLFVDDDTMLGSMVLEGLTFLGHQVHYQSSMTALASVIREFKPNILILDVDINDRDGIEDSGAIRIQFPRLPILIVSSHIDSSYVVRALNQGAVSYIKKPIDFEELHAYIVRHADTEANSLTTIGIFVLDSNKRLLRNTQTEEVNKLNQKETLLLLLLVEKRGEAVTREEILDEIWRDNIGGNQVLNNYIARLRRLMDVAGNNTTIDTLPRHGYRLISTE